MAKRLKLRGRTRVIWVDPNEIERAAAEDGAAYIADECANSEEMFNWARRGGEVAVMPAGERYLSHRDADAMEDNAAACGGWRNYGDYPGAWFGSDWAINAPWVHEELSAEFPNRRFKFYRLAPVSAVIGQTAVSA